MKKYSDFADLAEVYLEDSFVFQITQGVGSVSFVIQAVLTPRHPKYRPPKPGDQYCYAIADLVIDGVTDVRWNECTNRSYIDATGEADLGNIDSMEYRDGHYAMAGDWGQIDVYTNNAPRLIFR